ncbi:MAG: hypothetical protein ACTHOL_16530, partial [Luteibacter jiangsuensis]
MKYPVVAASIIAAHVAALVLVPDLGMAISYTFFFSVTGLAMVGVAVAWRRSGTPRDRRWWLLLASLAL